MKGYELLREKDQEVRWHGLVWNKWNVPKHSFMAWVYHHNNMNTMDKLYRLHISEEDTCWICRNSTETIEHLFFSYGYSQSITSKIGRWLEASIPCLDLLKWRLELMGSKTRKGIVNATINSCIYHIWRQRNQSKHENSIIRPEKVATQIIKEMRQRVNYLTNGTVKEKDRAFLQKINGAHHLDW
ncbi:uncharacterized protein LOC141641502 [Silene latifolia]|uniref:uncharacterized protein LOC141641502 n=1 Tax=Silene latifolia TaxID=37657 RepID=UPI003D76E5F7